MRLKLTYDRVRATAGMEVLDQRLFVLSSLIPQGFEPFFREETRYERARTSSAIEGHHLSENAALRLFVEGPDVDDPAQLETANLAMVYELLGHLALDETVQLDEGLIRAVHSILLRGVEGPQGESRGRYRVRPGAIIGESSLDVRYRPPAPEQIAELMEHFVSDVRTWHENRDDAPITAALTHFGLVSIHPFEDGNGRTARAVADLLMDQGRATLGGLLTVSAAILETRDEYYKVLADVQGPTFKEEVDVTPFIDYHTRALSMAALSLEKRVITIVKMRKALEGTGQAQRTVTGAVFMGRVGPIPAALYARFNGVSHSTAVSDLNGMIKLGMVEKRGAGRNTRYGLTAEFMDKAKQAASSS